MRKYLLCLLMLIGCSSSKLGSPNPGTNLVVSNTSSATVTAMLTLSADACVNDVSKIPWSIKPMGNLKGTFSLGPGTILNYNSGKGCSFTGNITFGKNFDVNPGCSSSDYPNAANIAEFNLNRSGETIDISAVNGVNAKLRYALIDGAPWFSNDPSVDPIKTIVNRGMGHNADIPGVFGWGADNCTESSDPPNPKPGCKAPINALKPEVSQKATCNVQRQSTSPNGGTVVLTFSGFL